MNPCPHDSDGPTEEVCHFCYADLRAEVARLRAALVAIGVSSATEAASVQRLVSETLRSTSARPSDE